MVSSEVIDPSFLFHYLQLAAWINCGKSYRICHGSIILLKKWMKVESLFFFLHQVSKSLTLKKKNNNFFLNNIYRRHWEWGMRNEGMGKVFKITDSVFCTRVIQLLLR